MSDEAIKAAIAEHLKTATTPDDLLVFWLAAWDEDLQPLLIECLRAFDHLGLEARLVLADLYADQGDADAARRQLRQAALDALTVFDNARSLKKIRDLAARVGDPDLADGTPSRAELIAGGFAPVPVPGRIQGRLTVDRPGRYALLEPAGVGVLAVWVKARADRADAYKLSVVFRPLPGAGQSAVGGQQTTMEIADPAEGATLTLNSDHSRIIADVRAARDGEGFELTLTTSPMAPRKAPDAD